MYRSFVANHFIDKLSGLADLTAADVAALTAATARPRRYPARRDLISEGDQPGPVIAILDGWVCRYKLLPAGSRQIMAFMIPGDSCDLHTPVLSQMDHSIQALTDATVAMIPRAEMQAMMETSPTISRAMYTAQLIDQATLRAWIVSMGRRSSVERVAHLMCELYLRARNIGMSEESGMVLPLTQTVLADSLGMTPVHINRVLKDLRLAGAMDLRNGSLVILNARMLVQIAGFDENYLHRDAHAPNPTIGSL